MKISFLTGITLAGLFLSCADKQIQLTVHADHYGRTDCVVSADVSKIVSNKSVGVALYEQADGRKKAVTSQLVTEQDGKSVLYWTLDGATPAGTTRTYIAHRAEKVTESQAAMSVEDTYKSLIIRKNGDPVLQYYYALMEAPEGVDPAFGRSGFIHPAWSPAGNVLTNIQPEDHRHHYGIWNPWTHIVYDSKLYDLWNLGDKLGTVRARSVETIYRGDVFSGFTALLDHVIFTPEGEKVIMNEHWNIRAWNAGDGFLWDFESDLAPSTALPVLLQAYRYAGFGYRATSEWTKENCEMLTSEGKTRQEIDGTRARWIFITGSTATGRSGLLFLGHPDNHNAPEPLRIWDENANGGRGDAFINFAPTKNEDWELLPGKEYVLKYRIYAFEGNMTAGEAERLWNDFAHPPRVTIK